MLHIAIANEQASIAVDEQRLRQAVLAVLEGEGLRTATVSLAIVDDPTIHRLNREFLQHDAPTDVLSFTLNESDSTLEGEVVASADTAAAAAARLGSAASDELMLYVIHGVLHLVGYDDQGDHEQAEMRKREVHYLGQFGIVPQYDVGIGVLHR